MTYSHFLERAEDEAPHRIYWNFDRDVWRMPLPAQPYAEFKKIIDKQLGQ
jgi:hypothetical protein